VSSTTSAAFNNGIHEVQINNNQSTWHFVIYDGNGNELQDNNAKGDIVFSGTGEYVSVNHQEKFNLIPALVLHQYH